MAEVEWIKLYVGVFENKKIKDIRRTYGHDGNDYVLIWIMLLTLAGQCNSGGKVSLSSKKNYTLDSLADELGFSKSTLQAAIIVLSEEYGMLFVDEDFNIRINNWEKYQNIEGMEKLKEGNRRRSAAYRARKKQQQINEESGNNISSHDESHDVTEQKREEKEEEKEIKHSVHCDNCPINEKCEKTIDAHFEQMWKMYPEKKGKGNVSKTQKQKLYKISLNDMEHCIRRYVGYVESVRKESYQLQYKNGSTFFNSGYLDYLEEINEKPIQEVTVTDEMDPMDPENPNGVYWQ